MIENPKGPFGMESPIDIIGGREELITVINLRMGRLQLMDDVERLQLPVENKESVVRKKSRHHHADGETADKKRAVRFADVFF